MKIVWVFSLLAVIIGCSNRVATRGFGDSPKGIVTQSTRAKDKTRNTALVIGNNAYQKAPLRNAANDAYAVAQALESLKWDVILKTDATRGEMKEAIREFGNRLEWGGVGLFFYSGHGIQVHGVNYLIPINAEIEKEIHVDVEAIQLGEVMGEMEYAGNHMNLIFLDACRDNPFVTRRWKSILTRGLAEVHAPSGTLIAYATAPGKVASDGQGDNGVFTKHLLRFIAVPGLEIGLLLRKVRKAVAEETNGKQIPWENSSLMGAFAFVEGNLLEQRPAIIAPQPHYYTPPASSITPSKKPKAQWRKSNSFTRK